MQARRKATVRSRLPPVLYGNSVQDEYDDEDLRPLRELEPLLPE
jgi:hypothetical protein